MALEHFPAPGDIYQDKQGNLYRVIGFQPNPTVTIEQITRSDGTPLDEYSDRPKQTHAIGCRNAEPFTKIGAFPTQKTEIEDFNGYSEVGI